jgi:hypothetical protein
MVTVIEGFFIGKSTLQNEESQAKAGGSEVIRIPFFGVRA